MVVLNVFKWLFESIREGKREKKKTCCQEDDKYFYAQATQYEKMGNKADAIASYKKITGDKYKTQAEYKISELGG